MLSTWQRKNEPLIIALGHTLAGGGLSCDVVLVAPSLPEHEVELADGEKLYPVEVPRDWFGVGEARVYYGVALPLRER